MYDLFLRGVDLGRNLPAHSLLGKAMCSSVAIVACGGWCHPVDKLFLKKAFIDFREGVGVGRKMSVWYSIYAFVG